MENGTNKVNLFIALGFGFLFVFIPNFLKNSESFTINRETLISILIYAIFCYLAIYAYSRNKISGIILLCSISLISPNLFENFRGELYPITIVIFSIYFAYNFGRKAYKKWKSYL